MRNPLKIIVFSGIFCQLVLAVTGPDFDDFFVKKTMRIDYYETGISNSKTISLDMVKEEPIWAGSCTNLIDTLNLGLHIVQVRDNATGQLIYSKGFNSLFAEWQTTDEAIAGISRTMSSSLLIPYPKNTVRVSISSRNKANIFSEEFAAVIDPNSRFVNHDGLKYPYKVKSLFQNGSPNEKLDILILPEGYTKSEIKQFRSDLKRLTDILFAQPPFSDNKDKFNVWYIEAPSPESGVDDPRKGVFVNTLFGLTYNTFDTDRYVQGFDNKLVRDVAAAAPYDKLYFILNSTKYGGGGIFNYCSISYAREEKEENAWIPGYVFVHEFGHGLSGLADEYYSSSTSYNDYYPAGIEPWEPNITSLLTPGTVKWSDLVLADTPLPTPWAQAQFDSIEYRKTQERSDFLRQQPYWGKTGAFEGGGYSSKGLYRPCLDCIMFSKTLTGFCPVCQDALMKVIRFNAE